MSDRSRVELYYMRKDELAIWEELGSDALGSTLWEREDEYSPGCVRGTLSYLAQGGYDHWQRLAEEGILFYGMYESGRFYHECLFASDGKSLHLTRSVDGQQVIRVSDNLEASGQDAEAVKSYLIAVCKVKEAMDKDEVSNRISTVFILEGYYRVLTDEAYGLVKLRQKLRAEKKWDEADHVRGKLEERGVVVRDTRWGTACKTSRKHTIHIGETDEQNEVRDVQSKE